MLFDNVTGPVNSCVFPFVVMFAAKSEAPNTDNEVAPYVPSDFWIAELRSSAPVIAITPSLFVPPTTLLNLTIGSFPPVVIVKSLAVTPSLFTVEPKTMVSLPAVAAVFKVLAAPLNVTAPE